MADSKADRGFDIVSHPLYPRGMVITNGKKTGYIAFRVTEVMEQQFAERHPENTTKSMILRELLREVDGHAKMLTDLLVNLGHQSPPAVTT